MDWTNITNYLSFTGIKDITVWQDVTISTLLIPLGIISVNWLFKYLNSMRPSRHLLKGFLKRENTILVFHSQMSGADDHWNFNPNQKYITLFPDPLPTDRNNLNVQQKQRIDPILSQSESDCLSEIYNVLGRCGKVENIISADLIKDWGKWSHPMMSIGFNPKTMVLIKKCKPIYFKLEQVQNSMEIRHIDDKVTYDAYLPNDAGVIQKTFTKNGRVPVFIFAGLGTAGTEVAGYVFNKYLVELGKLYGNNPFCAYIRVTTNEGKESAFIDKLYPHPAWHRIAQCPITYLKFRRKELFIE